MDNNNNNKNGFSYTYSAKEQAELKRIREKYSAPTDSCDKMTRLRKLDASVTNTAQGVAIVFGVLGTLTLGLGMSLIMTDLSQMLELSSDLTMIIGITIGIIGGILASLAYPIYTLILKTKRKKIAPEIIRLTDELLK